MKRLLLFFSILHISHSSCPSGFDLVSDGQCRGLAATVNMVWDYSACNVGIEKCDALEADTVSIHNDEQQAYWKERAPLLIGLECNSESSRWHWVDGSPLDYKPHGGNYDSGKLIHSTARSFQGRTEWSVSRLKRHGKGKGFRMDRRDEMGLQQFSGWIFHHWLR
ncbi:hypothetical protein PENTCL1PPCAC_25162 [Pristionchus entomophagus]|uniref:C-type lectin n=1 Tax=Pristionchus entomophagus TaxID=358040 RepID=A0AAV5U8K2_9BILA|nr:hypothetical protein PENTCL1PPCAC_25162 [Pristionchus entomophagus]